MNLPSCNEHAHYDRELEYAIELHIAAHGELRTGCAYPRGGDSCKLMLHGFLLSRLARRVRERRRLWLALGFDFIPMANLPGANWAFWRAL